MGLLSGRVPSDYAPNPLARLLEEKRSAGRPVLDLTTTNPTRVGLPRLELSAEALFGGRELWSYDPDPLGPGSAREAIAEYYRARSGGLSRVDPGRLVLTSSTSEAYAHLFRLLCNPGDEVLVPTPSYPLFEPLADLEAVQLRTYELERAGRRWALRPGSIERALGPRTKAVVAVQPNNPTGSVLSAEEIVAVETACAARSLAIISDEVFGDFPWGADASPLPTLFDGRSVPTFVLGGLSKLCGLPQMKLGWIVVGGPDRALETALAGLEWISDLFLPVGAPIQVALPALLAARSDFQDAIRARIQANLKLLRGARRERSAFELLETDGGWSAVLRFEKASAPGSDTDAAEWLLRDRDVLTHPGHFYDLGDQDVVVSLIVETEALEQALPRMRDGC